MPLHVQCHENVKNLCDCLNKEISNFPPYSGSFVNQFVCDSGKEGCMMGNVPSVPTGYMTLGKMPL